MWFISNKFKLLFLLALIASSNIIICGAISNSNFNSNIRDYTTDDINNTTKVKTLQKEELGRYANFTPANNPIKFKEIPDSTLSSTSNSRGLLYHNQPGYTIKDYEEGPHFPYGPDYHFADSHPDVHSPHDYQHDHHIHHDHHGPHDYDHHHFDGHHHLDHGYYNRHYKHALAAKTVLWPIAGLALLGAAAALVSNPVLLQLGVISGKRRRRDTEEITGPDFPSDTFLRYAEKIKKPSHKVNQLYETNSSTTPNESKKSSTLNENFKRRLIRADNLKKDIRKLGLRKNRTLVKRIFVQPNQVTTSPSYLDDDRFIAIPIMLRDSKVPIP